MVAVSKFADQLFTDLMREYQPALERRGRDTAPQAGRPDRQARRRPDGPPGRRWLSWLAPLAAAAGVAAAVGVAAILGQGIGAGRLAAPPAGAGQPRYYVQAGLCCSRPVVRSSATGKVTARVPVPVATPRDIGGYGVDMVASARGRTFFVAAFAPPGDRGQRIYRFRVTRSGKVSGFAAVPGGIIGDGQWEADAMAASPDGRRVAIAFRYDGNARKPPSDYIAVVDTATGARTMWRGSSAALGRSFSVASLSWTADGRELVFLGQWCHSATAPYNSNACGGSVRRIAEVRALNPVSGGGRVDSGRLLLRQSARFPYIAQALISPDGSTITAVVLAGGAKGAHDVSGLLPDELSVTQISVATHAQVRVLYRRRLGPTSQIIGAPDCLILSQDIPGRHWMLDGGISGGAGRRNGFNGWIDAGRLVPLPPADGDVAGQAW